MHYSIAVSAGPSMAQAADGSPNEDTGHAGRGEVQGVEGELEEEEVWLGGLLAHIFMVQDMNSHPLFGVDGGHKSNQVRVASFWL